MVRNRFYTLFVVGVCVAATLLAPSVVSAGDISSPVVQRVTDSLSTVVVEMPDALLQRLSVPAAADIREEDSRPTRVQQGRTVGYRVQIYSDNNQRTARAEAERRAAAVRSHFPEYRAYVVFQSPYWRVRVGDFRSRSQAEDAVAQMRRILPAYGKEMRVVKDRVTVD